MISLWNQIKIVFSLLKRDYATQYSGTLAGIFWIIFQSIFQIFIFFILFGFVLTDRSSNSIKSEYLTYVVSGMALWLPIAEMMIRSGSLLTENRALIRRTPGAIGYFLSIPFAGSIVQYSILFTASILIILLTDHTIILPLYSPIAFIYGIFVLFFFSGYSRLIGKAAVLLKDLTPIVRLLVQILFFATPIVYISDLNWFSYNPLFGLIDLHRQIMTGLSYTDMSVFVSTVIFSIISILLFYAGTLRLEESVMDQL